MSEPTSDGASVRFYNGRITWNGQVVDEAGLARRAAIHWAQKIPHAMTIDADMPAPDDHGAIAKIKRVQKLARTKAATLEKTLRKLADGTY